MIVLWSVGVIALLLAIRWLWRQSPASRRHQNIPTITGSKDTDYKALIEEQYTQR